MDVAGKIVQTQRTGKVTQVVEQLQPGGQLHQPPHFVLRQTGGDEVVGLSRLVDGDDHAVARAGERTGAVGGLLEHGGHVEAPADAQDGRAQSGETLPERFDLGIRRILIGHRHLL